MRQRRRGMHLSAELQLGANMGNIARQSWSSALRPPSLTDCLDGQHSRTMPPKYNKQAAGPELPLDAPERRRLPLVLRRAWYGLNQAFRRRRAPLGLTPDQFTVLRTLLEHEGIKQRELTGLMSSDANTVASLLERMERAGLVGRQAHEKDRRAHRLQLKPNGQRKYVEAREVAAGSPARIPKE